MNRHLSKLIQNTNKRQPRPCRFSSRGVEMCKVINQSPFVLLPPSAFLLHIFQSCIEILRPWTSNLARLLGLTSLSFKASNTHHHSPINYRGKMGNGSPLERYITSHFSRQVAWNKLNGMDLWDNLKLISRDVWRSPMKLFQRGCKSCR